MSRRSAWLAWTVAVSLGALALGPLTSLADRPAVSAAAAPSEAARLFAPIYTVLTHPRCLNCHTGTDYPRQGDDRHRHRVRVVRGADGRGAPGARCASCHGPANHAASGVPGGKGWHLAPLSMAWEREPGVAMTPAELCRSLVDRETNGGMSLGELHEHMASEALVLWAWQPGTDARGQERTPPPIPHADLLTHFEAWTQAGAPCPP